MARTTGSTSFVRVALRELNRVLKENATVVVNRRYVEGLELQCQPFTASKAALAKLIEQGIDAPESKPAPITINTVTFDE